MRYYLVLWQPDIGVWESDIVNHLHVQNDYANAVIYSISDDGSLELVATVNEHRFYWHNGN